MSDSAVPTRATPTASCGTPAVVTRIAGHADLVEHEALRRRRS